MTNSLLSKLHNANNGMFSSEETDEEVIRTYTKPESSYCSIANANPFFRMAIFREPEYQRVIDEDIVFTQSENSEEVKKGY